jgi:signal-transduction protein with cAMP-binding, CBS, and nucleotidyltransferase domain
LPPPSTIHGRDSRRDHDHNFALWSENETLEAGARKKEDLDVGALPICGEDNPLKGMITYRDIVIKCFAEGGDPHTAKAGALVRASP